MENKDMPADTLKVVQVDPKKTSGTDKKLEWKAQLGDGDIYHGWFSARAASLQGFNFEHDYVRGLNRCVPRFTSPFAWKRVNRDGIEVKVPVTRVDKDFNDYVISPTSDAIYVGLVDIFAHEAGKSDEIDKAIAIAKQFKTSPPVTSAPSSDNSSK